MLTVYKETVPRSKSHRATITFKESIQHCVARPFNDIDEALRIYNIPISLKHPNLLGPLGLWTCYGGGRALDDKAKAGKEEKSEAKVEEPMEEMKIKAFITFPEFDGALVDLPREEILLIEDNNSLQTSTYGFTHQGSKLFLYVIYCHVCLLHTVE